MEKKVQYTIKHIGINNKNEEEARENAKLLCSLFNVELMPEAPTNIFAGSLFECMKHDKTGRCGHIALQTDDLEAAMEDLASKGIHFKEETIKRDESGKVTFVYLVEEVAGFAFHLTV
ncbi:MAG: glyoxalase/bleomycin resistance/dioxygenase family protein [Firmicutes bacterium]|nr:glyoxalase/bleomycin resistance/dioxygenase family protein [Bacillota bacterium]